ncbi:MAG: 5-(carboxyamino)imidazole ribonucleotide synthase [Bacteroidia bacterium]|nr:5-(carboxyamino)imidazole ribonucleotide synthase [Bacteroidia bacterium]
MEQLVTSNFKLGIIAGGQLGKMLALAASNWDVKTYILDPKEDCPAAHICTNFTKGNYNDYDIIYEFGKKVDMITFDIENINIDALLKLKAEGKRIFPEPEILKVIQDKGAQKEFYRDHQIPTSGFQLLNSKQEILNAISNKSISIPFVQKLRTSGYDGKGVEVIRSEKDLEKLMEGSSLIEEMVDIEKEIAVIVARNTKGEVKTFPTVEMEFNPNANLVERLICPAHIDEKIDKQAQEIAKKVIENFQMTGILAVEMFITKTGVLLVNEIAPRPHNSGHHTIESCITSQYEQHLRAILGFPLGDTSIKMPSVMINLLGEKGHSGNVKYEGLTECMAISGVKIHIYGKKDTQPFRKMGHVTVLDRSIDSAKEKAKKVSSILKVKSWN